MLKTVFFSFLSRFGPPMLAGLIVYLVCLVLFFRRKKPLQKFWLAILFLYLGAVIHLTIPLTLPQSWHIRAKTTAWAISQIQWIPFQSAGNILKNSIRIGSFKEFLRVIGGNFVLLMPLGVLVPLINPRFRLGRMIAVSLLVPIGIEGLQLLHNILAGSVTRSVEMEDVVLNAAGCLTAYLIFAGLRKLFRPKRTTKQRT
ncbi:MAG: VanZ like family protein [Eubacteriales bacterium]|jgi:glycopeptide antibiotics resistance protein